MSETKEKPAELSRKTKAAHSQAKREADAATYKTILIAASVGVIIGLFLRR